MLRRMSAYHPDLVVGEGDHGCRLRGNTCQVETATSPPDRAESGLSSSLPVWHMAGATRRLVPTAGINLLWPHHSTAMPSPAGSCVSFRPIKDLI
jgi:hypothetical protein